MKYLIFSLFVTTSVFAADLRLNCKGSLNTDTIMAETIELSSNISTIHKLGGNEQFTFFIKRMVDNSVQLHAYDEFEPSRSYATANLSKSGDFVDVFIWKREFLLEGRCTLL